MAVFWDESKKLVGKFLPDYKALKRENLKSNCKGFRRWSTEITITWFLDLDHARMRSSWSRPGQGPFVRTENHHLVQRETANCISSSANISFSTWTVFHGINYCSEREIVTPTLVITWNNTLRVNETGAWNLPLFPTRTALVTNTRFPMCDTRNSCGPWP